ncbi:MAG: PEP-CTERM sorting domain-containing protein [Acidobacteria bacterium]|nr:PEP-CTERM sorting domain-containing protein [Acidobacteriota bacterium]
MVNTEGFETIDVSLAGIRTATGFNNNEFMYTVDSGVSWTDFGTYDPGTSFGLQAFDLSGIPALNNNPYAGFRIVFWGATSSSGNNRIDNLVVSGAQTALPPAPVPEPSTIVLTAAGMVGLFLRLRRHQ